MAVMAVQKIVDAGTAPTHSAANTTDTAVVGSGANSFLHVKNGSASVVTVTITDYLTADNGDSVPPHVVSVPAISGSIPGESWIPLRKSYDKGDGTGAQIAYSAVTTVTSALVQVQ